MKNRRAFANRAASQLLAFLLCTSAAIGQPIWKQEYDAGVNELKGKQANINLVLSHFQKAVKSGRAAGIKGDDWKRCLWNLGTTQREAGKYVEAEKTLTELIDVEKKEGKETEFTADALAEMALVKHLEKDYKAADKLYGKAIPEVRKIRRANSQTKADEIWGWSDTKVSLGDFSGAIALKEEALAIRREMAKRDIMMEAVLLSDLAETGIKSGNNKEAMKWGQEAQDIFKKDLPRHATGLADASYYVAVAACNLGKYEEGSDYAKFALKLHAKIFGEKSKEVTQDQKVIDECSAKISRK